MNPDKEWQRKKVWLFLTYIAAEPFRQVYRLLRETPKRLYYPKAWLYIFSTVTVILIVQGKKIPSLVCMSITAFFLLLKEYESGEFMHHYRQKWRKQMTSSITKNGEVSKGKT